MTLFRQVSAIVAAVMLTAAAQAKEVTIAHQDMWNPWRVAIANQELEKATGWKINWKLFGGGADVIRALASGDVAIGEAGSSPIAAGVSQGVDVSLFWILEDIASAEALVVRNGSGIVAPQDLKGKKIATPFVSTSHFHLLFALEQFGLKPNDVQVVNLRPADIAAAWERGDIDGAFVWDPALSRIKQTGKVLITSGELSTWGKSTFDGIVVNRKFAAENPDFVVAFVKAIAAADERYRQDRAKWTADSPEIAAIAKITGGKPEDIPAGLALYGFPTLAEQVSPKWLGGGKEGGAAKALLFTAQFLKEQGRITEVKPDYADAVDSSFAEKALGK
jgi:taurine transport system substrate-binding protein